MHSALDKYNAKIYSRKKKKLREDLAIGKSVLLLNERIKKSQRRENLTKAQFKIFLFLIKRRSLLSETKKQ